MATVKAVVLKQQQKEDGTWNIKIRITHERKVAYMATPYFVTIAQINRKTFELKENNPVYDQVMLDVLKIRAELSAMGHQVNLYTAQGLVQFMKDRLSGKKPGINFFDFAEKHVRNLIKEGKRMSGSYHAMLSRLEEFNGSRELMFSDINSQFLYNFDTFLRNAGTKHIPDRKITPSGVNLYMSKIKHLFNLAKLEYNDEDTGLIRIANNPFAKYKMPAPNRVRKKALPAEIIRKIKTLEIPSLLNSLQVARDAFIISFLLCGMNSADMFYLKPAIDGRFEYERRKTANRRGDRAFISVRIEPELLPYMGKYKDPTGERAFDFYTRYANENLFATGLNIHLKRIGEMVGIPNLVFYAARHSFATIARNDCEASMDDVAMCLNHKSGHSITDIYVKKDWRRIDETNRKVIDFVFNKL